MKLVIEQIINSKDVLKNLGSQKMNASIAFKIQRNIRKLNPEIENFQTVMKDIVEKYSDKKDNYFEVRESERNEYQKELNELLKEEVEVDISQINIDDFSNIQLTPFELMQIDWMFI
jgi:hypothetical protein